MYDVLISLSNKDKRFLDIARSLAFSSKENNKHGAIIVKNRRVLGVGKNKRKNHPSIVSENHIKLHCSVHAEEDAIKNSNTQLKGATIYVARVNNFGIDRNSKPCSNCQALIEKHGIKKVVYTMESV